MQSHSCERARQHRLSVAAQPVLIVWRWLRHDRDRRNRLHSPVLDGSPRRPEPIETAERNVLVSDSLTFRIVNLNRAVLFHRAFDLAHIADGYHLEIVWVDVLARDALNVIGGDGPHLRWVRIPGVGGEAPDFSGKLAPPRLPGPLHT